jgi:hypothetical protein
MCAVIALSLRFGEQGGSHRPGCFSLLRIRVSLTAICAPLNDRPGDFGNFLEQ